MHLNLFDASGQEEYDGIEYGGLPVIDEKPLSVITLFGNTIELQVHNHVSRRWKRVRAQLVLSGVDGRRTPKTRKAHVLVDGVVRTHPLTNLRADFVAIRKRCRTEDGRYAMTVEVVDKALPVGVGPALRESMQRLTGQAAPRSIVEDVARNGKH